MKTITDQKAEMLQSFSQAIDANTKNAHDVWCLIHALQDLAEYAEDKRYKFAEDLPSELRIMRKGITDTHPASVDRFDEITDDLQAIVMIAGANAEGLVLLNSAKLREDLWAISDKNNR